MEQWTYLDNVPHVAYNLLAFLDGIDNVPTRQCYICKLSHWLRKVPYFSLAGIKPKSCYCSRWKYNITSIGNQCYSAGRWTIDFLTIDEGLIVQFQINTGKQKTNILLQTYFAAIISWFTGVWNSNSSPLFWNSPIGNKFVSHLTNIQHIWHSIKRLSPRNIYLQAILIVHMSQERTIYTIYRYRALLKSGRSSCWQRWHITPTMVPLNVTDRTHHST